MARQIILTPDFERTREIIVWSTIVDRIVFRGTSANYMAQRALQVADDETKRLGILIRSLQCDAHLGFKSGPMNYLEAMAEEKFQSGQATCVFCQKKAAEQCCMCGCVICENHCNEVQDDPYCQPCKEEYSCQI